MEGFQKAKTKSMHDMAKTIRVKTAWRRPGDRTTCYFFVGCVKSFSMWRVILRSFVAVCYRRSEKDGAVCQHCRNFLHRDDARTKLVIRL